MIPSRTNDPPKIRQNSMGIPRCPFLLDGQRVQPNSPSRILKDHSVRIKSKSMKYWQQQALSDASCSLIRRKMRTKITHFLEKTMSCEVQTKKMLPNKALIVLSDKFENRLYQMASSFEAYADPTTLDSRLKLLAMQTGKRMEARMPTRRDEVQHMEKVQDANCGIQYARLRQNRLRVKLGDITYKEMLLVVSEIRSIRRTSDLWISEACEQHSNCENEKRNAKEAMPETLRTLYFNNRLVNALAAVNAPNTTSLQMNRVDDVGWSELLEEARNNLKSFRLLEKSEGGSLEFRQDKPNCLRCLSSKSNLL